MTRFNISENWQQTIWSLHQAVMLIGPIHNAVFAPRTNYLHLPLDVVPSGLASQTLPKGGKVIVDFKAQAIVYTRGSGDEVRLPLANHTQASLFAALLAALKTDEHAEFFADAADDADLAAFMMEKLHADDSRVEFLKLEDVTHTEALTTTAQTASNYADALYDVYTGVARFRATLTGHMTSMVVWPEHFDLSTLIFHPDNAVMDDSKAHINFGFAPYTPDMLDDPYLYVYAYPYPDDFTPPDVPAPAYWSTEGFKGVVLKWEDIHQHDDIAAYIEAMCTGIYPAMKSIIDA